MPDEKTLVLAHFLDHARAVDDALDTRFLETLREAIPEHQLCDPLKNEFMAQIGQASVRVEIVRGSEMVEQGWPPDFQYVGDIGTLVRKVRVRMPVCTRVPNGAYTTCAQIVDLARDLDCQWVEEAQRMLDERR